MNPVYVLLIGLAILLTVVIAVVIAVFIPKYLKKKSSEIKIGDTIVPESATSAEFATVTFKNDVAIVDNDGNPTGSTATKGDYEWAGLSFNDRRVLIMFNNAGTLAAALYTKKDVAVRFN